MSGQLQAAAAYSSVSTELEAGWIPRLVWSRGVKTSLSLPGIETRLTALSFHNLVTKLEPS
jgi:hypothetical protein